MFTGMEVVIQLVLLLSNKTPQLVMLNSAIILVMIPLSFIGMVLVLQLASNLYYKALTWAKISAISPALMILNFYTGMVPVRLIAFLLSKFLQAMEDNIAIILALLINTCPGMELVKLLVHHL